MLTDQQGNRLTGATAESVALFDRALEAFNLYRGDPVALLDQAVAAAPEFAMAHLMKAYLFAVATEPEATRYARTMLEHIRSIKRNERESSLLAALELLLGGSWTAAAVALDRHCMHFPRDLLALQCGHLLDFYRAGTRNLRDRLARALPHWTPDIPGYAVMLGMYAFGLEENGDYARAEATGRRAVALQPLDCWAHHAVTHVMEMQGRAEDGVGWMMTREPHWSGDDNFFKVHNWWHCALFHLELGQQKQALALYDGPIRAGHSSMALDLVDASALLWRLQLSGLALGERWQELSDTWEQHADGRLYPFNDWHAAMACLGAGREHELERILRDCRAGSRETGEVPGWTRDTGLPLIEGFVAFWRGDFPLATEKLYGARYIVNRFGGSHAQRDIIDWTLTEAAVRGGLHDLARGLAHERLALKPHSVVNLDFLARCKAVAPTNPAS